MSPNSLACLSLPLHDAPGRADAEHWALSEHFEWSFCFLSMLDESEVRDSSPVTEKYTVI